MSLTPVDAVRAIVAVVRALTLNTKHVESNDIALVSAQEGTVELYMPCVKQEDKYIGQEIK